MVEYYPHPDHGRGLEYIPLLPLVVNPMHWQDSDSRAYALL